MSDQGPGGYGGGYGGGGPPGGGPPGGAPPGGQGGWGQPPGAPPGGYGQPPGGYGQPPGGYGPPGAPPGWQPQPGYGQPPPGPPPAAKTNPLLWAGLGCGALLLIGGAGSAYFYFAVFRPAQQLVAAATAASGLGATVSISDGGIVLKVPGVAEINAAAPEAAATPGAATPGAGAQAAPGTPPAAGSAGASALPAPTTVTLTPGGPSCAPAAACCKAMLEKTGAGAQAGQCEQMKSAPEAICAQALATYRKTAPLVGASCP